MSVVLIVYGRCSTFRSLAVHYPFAEGPSTSPFVLSMSLICIYFHCPTANHWLQLYHVVLVQPFHSSLCSPNAVHLAPSFNSSSPADWALFPFSLGPSLCIVHHSLSTLAPPHTHIHCTLEMQSLLLHSSPSSCRELEQHFTGQFHLAQMLPL